MQAFYGGRVVIIGYGTIAQCAAPLLFDRLGLAAERVTVVDRLPADDFRNLPEAEALGYHRATLRPDNLGECLAGVLSAGDLVLNLSVGVDSVDLADFCQRRGALYLDTAIEPWEGYVEDEGRPAGERTEYALHQRARAAGRRWAANGPTALFTHGANPGLVSHFAKAALVDVAQACGMGDRVPEDRPDWARLAARLGVRVVHISERDTQIPARAKRPGEFVNTWSIAGFVEEAMMPVEIGWGTHETDLPEKAGEHLQGPRNAIFLERPGGTYLLLSWTPTHGQIAGMALPHSENVTISEYLSICGDGGEVRYRPTVSFVYLPCDDALASLHETMMAGWQVPEAERVITDEVRQGSDELGVLLLGHPRNGWWYGSSLDVEEARRIVPHSNPTALQVAAGVVAGALWVTRNPGRGYCEPEDLPHGEILQDARQYLGKVLSVETDWTPLSQRRHLFGGPPEPADPWQFRNFRP